ncbi:MAG: Mur ligase family protein [Gemmatimonadota bacterium]
MKLRDSRRLTGPNLLLEGPGAVIDVGFGVGANPADRGAIERGAVESAWRAHARTILEAVGWGRSLLAVHPFPRGLSLAFSAPEDALYAATEVNEWAWAATCAELGLKVSEEEDARELESLEQAAGRLRAAITEESDPALLALRDAAARHDVTFLTDEDATSVGMGDGCRCWPTTDLPDASEVDWDGVRDVPIALITGTNGKTTTVRLLCAIARAAGLVPGATSTDGIVVGDEVVDADDWAGPGGARQVLRMPEVEAGILETARGGILRRGLGVPRAHAALVTNVAEDHLGEYGVEDVAALADVKLVVGRVVVPAGRVVLNAEDERVVVVAERARREGHLRAPITWFSLDPRDPRVSRHVAEGGDACALVDRELVLWRAGRIDMVTTVERVPITLDGAARFNVRNALAAVGVAAALGWPVEAMAAGLSAVRGTPEDNPGRLNLFELGGARVLVDFAHNPHGMSALLEAVASLPARRRLIVIGQAGDRDDESIRRLVRETWAAQPALVIVKEMEKYLRGRPVGEVPGIIVDELRRLGTRDAAIRRTDSEMEAVHAALEAARPGDLVVLTVHSDREEVLGLLSELRRAGWSPGEALPGGRVTGLVAGPAATSSGPV